MSDKPKDFPFLFIADVCEKHLAKGRHFHQKFTCANCGVRQTMEVPDRLYTKGKCEECGQTTDIEKNGCNYLLIGTDEGMLEELFGQLKDHK